jgi:hypothetical protein
VADCRVRPHTLLPPQWGRGLGAAPDPLHAGFLLEISQTAKTSPGLLMITNRPDGSAAVTRPAAEGRVEWFALPR